jgi:8-oxo-dGTP pyrophosphatase MutT (NUDIX family)
MRHIQSAGGIVISPGGKVLIVTNEIGTRTFPKGSMKPGETPIETARREIAEETGLTDLVVHKKLGILVRPGNTVNSRAAPSVTKHIHLYLCTTSETRLKPQAPDVIKAEWVKPADVAAYLSHASEADFFQRHHL